MNRFRLFQKQEDCTPLLDSLFQRKKETSGDKQYDSWETPFGVKFTDINMKAMWQYEYDSDLPYCNPEHRIGVISPNDIISAIEILRKDPEALRRVSPSVLEIQKEVGGKILRHESQFGRWRWIDDGISAFNNPFGLTLGYTDADDNFEIWFRELEEEPREYQPLEDVIEAIKKSKGVSRDPENNSEPNLKDVETLLRILLLKLQSNK